MNSVSAGMVFGLALLSAAAEAVLERCRMPLAVWQKCQNPTKGEACTVNRSPLCLHALVAGIAILMSACNPTGRHTESMGDPDIPLSGLWVSCPSSSQCGPILSELEIAFDGSFEMRLLARSPAEALWRGTVVLEGHVNRATRRLEPESHFELEGVSRSYHIVNADEMVLTTQISGEEDEHTQLTRVETLPYLGEEWR